MLWAILVSTTLVVSCGPRQSEPEQPASFDGQASRNVDAAAAADDDSSADATSSADASSAGESSADAGLMEQVRAMVQPWHQVDPEWLASARIVVAGELEQSSYPCIFHPDGSSDMPLRSTITVSKVLRRGGLQRPSIDFAPPVYPSTAFPSRYIEGRNYLLFINPSEDSAELLADATQPFTVWTQLGARDLVAIVDLDQTREEAAAHRDEVQTWERRQAAEMTVESWRELQGRRGVSAADVATALHTLREGLLPTWCTRADVRSVLGAPAERREAGNERVEVYFINAADRAAPRQDTLVARIELAFDQAGALVEYNEAMELYDDGAFRDATADERRARGLNWVRIDRRRGSPCPSPSP